jgi:hypothetical protein
MIEISPDDEEVFVWREWSNKLREKGYNGMFHVVGGRGDVNVHNM